MNETILDLTERRIARSVCKNCIGALKKRQNYENRIRWKLWSCLVPLFFVVVSLFLQKKLKTERALCVLRQTDSNSAMQD